MHKLFHYFRIARIYSEKLYKNRKISILYFVFKLYRSGRDLILEDTDLSLTFSEYWKEICDRRLNRGILCHVFLSNNRDILSRVDLSE